MEALKSRQQIKECNYLQDAKESCGVLLTLRPTMRAVFAEVFNFLFELVTLHFIFSLVSAPPTLRIHQKIDEVDLDQIRNSKNFKYKVIRVRELKY